MRIPPVTVILSWPEANYINPHTQGESLVITNAVFMALITLAVALRYYSRLRTHKWLGWDDIFIGVALLLSLGLGAAVILANVRYGWNRHIWDVKLAQFKNASIIAFVAKILFTLAATFTRVSLICFYFRLIRDSGHAKFRLILWSAMVWQVAVCITFVFLITFLCTPVDGYWNLMKSATTKCLDEGIVTLIAGIINCVCDLMVTVLPIPIVMRLNMPLRQRIGVSVLLSLGLVVTVAGIIRTYFIWKALIETYDETWYSYPLWICAAVEIDLAVLCACAPALKPLFSPMAKSDRSLSHSLRHSTQNSSPSGTHAGASDDSNPQPMGKVNTQTTRRSSRASSQRGILGGYHHARPIGKGDFEWLDWRRDADVEEGPGQVIELKNGLDKADDLGEHLGIASVKQEGHDHERISSGIGIEKSFDVTFTDRR